MENAKGRLDYYGRLSLLQKSLKMFIVKIRSTLKEPKVALIWKANTSLSPLTSTSVDNPSAEKKIIIRVYMSHKQMKPFTS